MFERTSTNMKQTSTEEGNGQCVSPSEAYPENFELTLKEAGVAEKDWLGLLQKQLTGPTG